VSTTEQFYFISDLVCVELIDREIGPCMMHTAMWTSIACMPQKNNFSSLTACDSSAWRGHNPHAICMSCF